MFHNNPSSSGISDTELHSLLKNMKNELIILGKKIKIAFQANYLPSEELLKWLQLSNAINMHKLCIAFQQGSAFYSDDAFHPNHKQSNFNTSVCNEPGLLPIAYKTMGPESRIYSISDSYLLAPGASASTVLNQLVFSKITLDCFAAVQISFYLSILDMFYLFYGKELGNTKFDNVFAVKKDDHGLNRLRIGTMGTTWTGLWHDFSPLYFFTECKHEKISMDLLRLHPEKYLGARVRFGGHPNYLRKHPQGPAQGWNTVFIGLDSQNQPLFLAACGLGQPFVYREKEILILLNNHFNLIPNFSEKQYINHISQPHQLEGFMEDGYDQFDIERIEYLIAYEDFCREFLKHFCDEHYRKQLLKKGYIPGKHSEQLIDFMVSKNIITETKDDHDYATLKFFKPNFRSDGVNVKVQDDLALNGTTPRL